MAVVELPDSPETEEPVGPVGPAGAVPRFEVVAEPDIEISDTDVDEQTVVCDACGKISDTVRGHNIHVGHVHPEQSELKKRRTKVESDVPERDRQKRTVRVPPEKRAKDRRVAKLRTDILETVNPVLIQSALLMGLPEPMLTVKLGGGIGEPTVRERIVFGDRQAGIIARGLVEMEGAPVVEAVVRVVTPFVPYAFGFAALGIVIMHGVQLFMLRKQLAIMQEQLNTESTEEMHFV